MAYTCDRKENVICDPYCDFCWYCKHDEWGAPSSCLKGYADSNGEMIGYCDDFRCSIHEEMPEDVKKQESWTFRNVTL